MPNKKVEPTVEPVLPEPSVKAPEVVAPVVEPVADEFVTLTAADPKMKLEVSINGEVWVGNSITVPKKYEGDVRRILEGASMYVKN